MISFFKRSASKLNGKNAVAITTDMHAHFLPGIDDGASDMVESLLLIQKLMESGYKKLIATPHVMSDFFKNTPEIILGKLAEVKEAVAQQGWQIEIEAAAEYYLDEFFI